MKIFGEQQTYFQSSDLNEMWILQSCEIWIFWATELIPKNVNIFWAKWNSLHEMHAYFALIEMHAYAMPTIFQVNHAYTVQITAI